jgi:hypothetical protein
MQQAPPSQTMVPDYLREHMWFFIVSFTQKML